MRKEDNPCFGCTAETGRKAGCHDYCQRHRNAQLEAEREKKWNKQHDFQARLAEHQIRKDSAVWKREEWNRNCGRPKK